MKTCKKSLFPHTLVWLLVFVMSLTASLPTQALAGFVPSSYLPAVAGNDLSKDLSAIQTLLESKQIRQRLQDIGLTSDEVLQRLQQLSPQQLHQLATHLDEIQPGGDSGLGIIVALLVIAILVVVLIQLTGHKIVIR
ncbi:MAG: PA2779 family protein [Nitrospirae bacterium]|nr:PA2779 family protein [Nitrospirota bacterium]